MMKNAALALLVPSGGGKPPGGYGSKEKKGDDEEKEPEADDAGKIRLSAAKDILDAEDAKALDKALYEYVCAVMSQEEEE